MSNAPRLAGGRAHRDPRHELAEQLPVDLCRKILAELDRHRGKPARGRVMEVAIRLADEDGRAQAKGSKVKPPWLDVEEDQADHI